MISMSLAAVFWLALHLIVAGPLRSPLAEKAGERYFFGIFCLLSIVGLGWFIVAYRMAPSVPLWPTIPALGGLAFVLVFLGFFLVVVGSGPMNSTDTNTPRMIDSKLPVYGVTRVTRHPRLCGVSLWAIAHLMVNGHLAALVMVGAVLVTALNGMVSIDRKRRRALGALWDEFEIADLAPAVCRDPQRPHPLRTCRVPCLAGRARGPCFFGRFLAARYRRAIAALCPTDVDARLANDYDPTSVLEHKVTRAMGHDGYRLWSGATEHQPPVHPPRRALPPNNIRAIMDLFAIPRSGGATAQPGRMASPPFFGQWRRSAHAVHSNSSPRQCGRSNPRRGRPAMRRCATWWRSSRTALQADRHIANVVCQS